jgi:hypothetical protein
MDSESSHIATDGQSVCLSRCRAPLNIQSWLKSYSLVHMGRPLWREVGSVICQSPWIHEWTVFYNSVWTEERTPPRTVRLLLFLFCPLPRNVPSELLPSNGGPSIVDCVTSGMCLLNRCLAVVIFVTILIETGQTKSNATSGQNWRTDTMKTGRNMHRISFTWNYRPNINDDDDNNNNNSISLLMYL